VIRSGRAGPRGRGWWILLLLVGLGGFVAPVRAAAQIPDLPQRQADYDRAKSALNDHSTAWSSQELVWQSTLEEVRAAGSADEDRLEAARLRSHLAAVELQRLKILVDNARRDVETKRRALEASLNREIDQVSAQIARGGSLNDRARLASLDAQLEGLQADAAGAVSLTLEYLPGFDLDPRMGPVRAASVVNFLGEKTREITNEIARVDGDLNRLLRTQDRQRTAGDRASNRTRFGDDQPVGASRPSASGAEAAGPTPTLQQRIDALRAQKATLNDMLQQLNSRVTSIRRAYPNVGAQP
jgi:hypothetical protein